MKFENDMNFLDDEEVSLGDINNDEEGNLKFRYTSFQSCFVFFDVTENMKKKDLHYRVIGCYLIIMFNTFCFKLTEGC